MAAITAQMVKALRTKTDLPMMECKQALSECDGDFEASIEWLRKKHKGKMADRSDRATGEGRIAVFIDDDRKTEGIIELQCETAPVAKNESFVGLANAFAKHVAEGSDGNPDPETVRKDPRLDGQFTNVYGRLRETMNLRQCRRLTGTFLASYIHHDGKSGVVVALDAEPKSEQNVAADLCMHTLFTNPIAIDRSGVPADQVEKVRSQAIELAQDEGKNESITAKIAEGKVNAFYAERVLTEQIHVKTDDYPKTKIGDVLKQAGVGAVTDLVVMKLGQ